jgi:hypothetical protein
MRIRNAVFVGLAFALLGAAPAVAVGQTLDQRTVLTFSQPFEIPGHVLPAGTYTFQLVDSLSDRHIVQVSSADGSRPIAIVLAIANYRLEATDKTVMTFNEVPVGSPETLRAWFAPGRNWGQEFVYPKRRALELAATSKVPVPAIAVPAEDPDLKTVPLVAVTPEQQEMPVAAVIQTTPAPEQVLVSTSGSQDSTQQGRQLPQTASPLFLAGLLGIASCGVAGALLLAGRVRGRQRPLPGFRK